MILSKLYPTQSNAQGFSLTAPINSISYGDNIDNPLDPYAMGYVKYEDFPDFLNLSEITSLYSDSQNKIIIKSVTDKTNHAWGYCARTENTSSTFNIIRNNNSWNVYIRREGNQSATYTNMALINSGYLAIYTLPNNFSLTLAISITNDDNTKPNGFTSNGGITKISDFLSFLDGDLDLKFTHNSNDYYLNINDFDDNGIVVLRDVDETLTFVVGIINFRFYNAGTGNGLTSNYACIQPWIKSNIGDDVLYSSMNELSEAGEGYLLLCTYFGTSGMTFRSGVATIYGKSNTFGIEGELDYNTVNKWAKNANSESYHYVQELNCFRSYFSVLQEFGHQWSLYPIFKPNMIGTLLRLRLKTYLVNTYIGQIIPGSLQYTTDINVNKYDSSNVPTGDILNGAYQDIISDLRPWQLWQTDIKTNTFDPTSDIPPYNPPSPDDDDNTESGDKIPNQFGRTVGVTSNFVTNYLMTEGQISKLGEVLWTSWADDTVTMDMVDNFYGKFHDATGSWNVSDALQFIVSCRLFPCSLATRVNTTQVTSIPIGTGAFALQCGTSSEPSFFIANEATAILNCGSVLVERKYNDYRDFENTKITAYLPFCGSVELNPQDVVGKWLGCTYAIDLFDGSCKAFIYTLSGDDVGYEGAYYNVAIKQGQCGFLIPLSATQAGQVASRQKVDGYTDGALLFNAGMSVIGAALESTSGGSPDTGIMKAISTIGNYGFQSDILSAQRSGRPGIAAPYLSGGSGFTDFHQPASAYIQIRRSYYQEPIEYEHSAGYPVNAQKYGNLSQFSGFITCSNVDISGFTCHEDERAEIKALLESGVYL